MFKIIRPKSTARITGYIKRFSSAHEFSKSLHNTFASVLPWTQSDHDSSIQGTLQLNQPVMPKPHQKQ